MNSNFVCKLIIEETIPYSNPSRQNKIQTYP